MKSIFRFFAERHTLAILSTILIILLGLKTSLSINRSIFPNVDNHFVTITTRYPGAAPEDVELNVTNKIEAELKGITGIKNMTSESIENVSLIELNLISDVADIEKVKTEIREAVARVNDLPSEVTESPSIEEERTSIIPIIEVGITGDIPYTELRKIARRFEKKVKSIPSVAGVSRFGYRVREIRIEVIPERLRQYQISMNQIITAIQARNIKATGGTLESYTSEKNVVTLAQFRYPLEVANVIVHTTSDGIQVKVKDVAIIEDGFEKEKFLARLNGKKAISFVIKKSETGDIIRTVSAIRKLANQFKEKYGDKIEFLYVNDASKGVENKFRIVVINGAIGLVLVLIVLAFFLNIRMAFWVAAGIPISLLGTVFLLPKFGMELDSITLTTMVLLIGIIVDDGIIITENIYRRRELGDSPIDAAVNGLHEVFLPVVTTVLTTFIAFFPMFFMSGKIGSVTFVVPLTVSLALFISLFESIVSLPAHLVPGLKKYNVEKKKVGKGIQIKHLKDKFEHLSKSLLKYRYILLGVAILLLAGSIIYAKTQMGFIMFSSKGTEAFSIKVKLPLGMSLAGTSKKIQEIEKLLLKLPEEEIVSFAVRIGTSGGVVERENAAVFSIQLTSFDARSRSADEIVEGLRIQTDKLQGYTKIKYSIDTGGPSRDKAIEIRVIGSNDQQRDQLKNALIEFLEKQTGVKDVDADDSSGKKQIKINLNYDWLARYGLTVSDVALNVRTAYDGQVVTNVRYGEEDVDFRIEMHEKYRKSIEFLKELPIPNDKGELIKLKKVAAFEIGPGPSTINHFGGDRTITVEADINQELTTARDVEKAVQAHFNTERDYPDTELSFGGEAEEAEEAMVDLGLTFVIAVMGIYFLLVLLFDSFSQPLLVLVTIPFGVFSVVLALGIHGAPLTLLGMIGAIGLAGVIVNDALVLVSRINYLRKEKPDESIINIVAEGTADRLRPILLTTVSTVIGIAPLAYGIGGMDLFMSPMALTLGFGLLFATPLTLFLIPCFYVIGTDISGMFKKDTVS